MTSSTIPNVHVDDFIRANTKKIYSKESQWMDENIYGTCAMSRKINMYVLKNES